MTRDLAVATRDTTQVEIARMMKQEDTGVIPVVEYDTPSGNGRTEGERNYEGRNYARGKLIGLITDRDIVIRAVAENKDCASTRAEDIMSVDITRRIRTIVLSTSSERWETSRYGAFR